MATTALVNEIDARVSSTVEQLKQTAAVNNSHLAVLLGMSRQSIQQKLNGRIRWTPGEIGALADYFGVPTEVLFMDPKPAVLSAVGEHGLLERRFDLRKAPSGCKPIFAGQPPRRRVAA